MRNVNVVAINGKDCITNTCLYTTYQTFITFATQMRIILVILCFFILLHKSNSNASAARSGHAVAIKAFALERKKSNALRASDNNTNLSEFDNSGNVSQFILWDCEESEEDGFICDVKFKVLSSFYLTLSPLYQVISSGVKPVFTTHERLNPQAVCAKYLAQRSIRI